MADLLELLADLDAPSSMTGPWPHFTDLGPAHGIVSMTPPTVRCDRCGATHSHPTSIHLAVILGGFYFNAKRAASAIEPDGRRLCPPCAWDEWPERRVDDYGNRRPRPEVAS